MRVDFSDLAPESVGTPIHELLEEPMTERLKPALSAEDWNRVRQAENNDDLRDLAVFYLEGGQPYDVRSVPPAIAVLNHALPDSDPRKITRAHIDLIHRAVVHESYAGGGSTPHPEQTDALRRFAAALESYLPQKQ